MLIFRPFIASLLLVALTSASQAAWYPVERQIWCNIAFDSPAAVEALEAKTLVAQKEFDRITQSHRNEISKLLARKSELEKTYGSPPENKEGHEREFNYIRDSVADHKAKLLANLKAELNELEQSINALKHDFTRSPPFPNLDLDSPVHLHFARLWERARSLKALIKVEEGPLKPSY